jgi:hypothetical protein
VSVKISGPGIEHPIELLDEIAADDTGVWHALSDYADPAQLPSAPTGDLGPRHALVWEMMSGPQDATPIRQDLYLDAPGGSVAHTPPGQSFTRPSPAPPTPGAWPS